MSLKNKKNALFGGGEGESSTPTPVMAAPRTVAAAAAPKGPVLSPAARATKLAEAEKHMATAHGFLKKTMFNWSPDHGAAAPVFASAANAFKMAGELERARETFVLAAEHHDKIGASGARALDLSKAADVSITMGDHKTAADLFRQSGESWAEHGETKKYSELLYRAAKALDSSPNAADDPIPVYQQALDAAAPKGTPQDRLAKLPAHCIELVRDLFRALVKAKDYAGAVAHGTRAADIFEALGNDVSLFKQLLCISLVQLAMGDSVAAEQTYTSHLGRKGYTTASESEVAEAFVMAFRDRDDEALAAAQALPKLTYVVEREMVTLAKGLSFNKKEKGIKPNKAKTTVPPTSSSAPAASPAAEVSSVAAKLEDVKLTTATTPVVVPTIFPQEGGTGDNGGDNENNDDDDDDDDDDDSIDLT